MLGVDLVALQWAVLVTVLLTSQENDGSSVVGSFYTRVSVSNEEGDLVPL